VPAMQGFAHLASLLPVLMAPGRHGIVLCRLIRPSVRPVMQCKPDNQAIDGLIRSCLRGAD